MEVQNEKTIYTYYQKYNRDLIDCIYCVSSENTKIIFTKKWGLYLNGKGKIVLNQEELSQFQLEASIFENNLEKAYNLQMKGYNLKQIKAYFSGESKETIDMLGTNLLERKQSIYDYFLESERLYVTQVIEWYKNNKITYFDVIVKGYGKFYDHYQKGVLTQKEELLFERIIGDDLPKRVNILKSGYALQNHNRGKKRKSSFFAYGKKDELLKKIEFWRQKNPKYICVLEKLYGPYYDELNEYVMLTEEETKIWNSIVIQLNHMKRVKQTESLEKKTLYQKIGNIPVDDSFSYLDFLILSARNQNTGMSDQALAEYLVITMEQLDDCYIRNLHLFKDFVPNMIKVLIKRNKNNVERILKESYLKNFLPYLTIEEQIYLQARLHSYYNSNLSVQDIAEYMCMPKEVLNEYQIMTPYEELNQLNKVFKRK